MVFSFSVSAEKSGLFNICNLEKNQKIAEENSSVPPCHLANKSGENKSSKKECNKNCCCLSLVSKVINNKSYSSNFVVADKIKYQNIISQLTSISLEISTPPPLLS
jgi:hypothetical protein